LLEQRLRYPTGVRPLLIEEAARRRRIEARFVALLEDAGFAEVVLPIIDYADPYAPLLSRRAIRQSYRFVDREGDLVGIRSDFTPMVARALAPSIRETDLPLRVFYRGDVVRCGAERLGVDRELFQIGAEIVGDPRAAADVEAMQLAAKIVADFGITPRVVWSDTSIASKLGDDARQALVTKRMPPSGAPPIVAKLINGTATLDDVRAWDAGVAARLDSVARALDPATFVLHLDDVEESAGYYTGIRFRVFGPDSRKAIAQGGRYDDLYARFGTPAAAVGFTFTIDDLD
jgi:ATP phosphoribosyltransferase regulatory subunit